jgi:hypothetical protein
LPFIDPPFAVMTSAFLPPDRSGATERILSCPFDSCRCSHESRPARCRPGRLRPGRATWARPCCTQRKLRDFAAIDAANRTPPDAGFEFFAYMVCSTRRCQPARLGGRQPVQEGTSMSWSQKPPSGPSARRPAEDRYAGKPLLLLLDSYVLDVIGALAPEQHPRLSELVQTAFGGGRDWKATLRETLQLDPETDAELRRLWQENQQRASGRAPALTAQEFARGVVDTNFAQMLQGL